jgi:hypothetical protein
MKDAKGVPLDAVFPEQQDEVLPPGVLLMNSGRSHFVGPSLHQPVGDVVVDLQISFCEQDQRGLYAQRFCVSQHQDVCHDHEQTL